MPKLPIECVDGRKKYILFKNDCGVSDVARGGGLYESYIFDWLKDHNTNLTGTTVVDVGANLGNHSLEFADMVGEGGQVVAFEAQRLTYYQLCGNIILNGYPNIFAHNIAIGNQRGWTLVETPNFLSPNTINVGNVHVDTIPPTHLSRQTSCLIKMSTLDDFFSVSRNGVSVLKIDVEGFEPYVLDGAKELIKQNQPIIFIEIWDVNLRVYDFKEQDVFDRLDAMGYKWEKLIKADHIIDYVAVPK